MMTDPRYEHPVAGIDSDQLAHAMRESIKLVASQFPAGTGVCVFAFDFGGRGGGMAYISNAERTGMVKALREWLNREARKS